MKKTFYVYILIYFVFCFGTAHGYSLRSGKYMFSSPALFYGLDNEAKLIYCQIDEGGSGKYTIYFLGFGDTKYLSMDVAPSGKVKLYGKGLSSSEVSTKVKGDGVLIADDNVKGKLRSFSGDAIISYWKKRTSDWFLRPATEEEVDTAMIKGLDKVLFLLYQIGMKPTVKNISKNLHVGVNVGYSSSDVKVIKRMLRSGQIELEKYNVSLRKDIASSYEEHNTELSISNEVIEEDVSNLDLVKDKETINKDKFNDKLLQNEMKGHQINDVDDDNNKSGLRNGSKTSIFGIRVFVAISIVFVVLIVVFMAIWRRHCRDEDDDHNPS